MHTNPARTALDLIGNTPVVKLNRLVVAGAAEVWGKLESMNPAGSVKDRICLSMIEAAERDGRLQAGATVVEATSGNTGIGLAMVAAIRGYRCILTMPDTMSEERSRLLTAYGATLVLTPDSRGMHAAVQEAEKIAGERHDSFMPQQFQNPANPEVHRRTTAEELLEQFEHIDAFVAGVGTGGTVTGVGQVLKHHMPQIKIYAVEPQTSAVLSGEDPGFHNIQGIGAGFVPDILDTHIYDDVIRVSDDDATDYTRRLARDEGILVGISSGANVCAALQVAKQLGSGKTIVTIFPDTGQRYLTTNLFQAAGI